MIVGEGGLDSRCLSHRSAGAEGVRGGEARRARGDAGRSRAAAGPDGLPAIAARTRVRAPSSRRHAATFKSHVDSRPLCRSRLSYFAVFDGHGGARASRFAAEHLHHNLAKKFPPTGEGGRGHSWDGVTVFTPQRLTERRLFQETLNI